MFDNKHPRLAFVDLETTGGTTTADRITEVGIIEVDEDGVREWSSLVNPGMHIPEFIQSLTGITDAMVEDAPSFAELADQIAARLAGRIFIAHNARFDHGFLKNEFKRTGHEFRPPVLCTVRLSRKLFPGFARHNLDAIVERYRLLVSERHRALGDARLIWQFWQHIRSTQDPLLVDETVSKLISRPSLPPRLDALQIEEIPDTHGVYLFYGANDLPLYIGKANKLRRRILSHFSGDHASARELELSQQIERIEWVACGGELGALLREAALVKQLAPSHNRQLRNNEEVCSWRLVEKDGHLLPVLATPQDLFFGHDPHLYGLFSSTRKAREALRAIAEAHRLCPALLGLEKHAPGKPCFASQVDKCDGACAGREPLPVHDERLTAALQSLHLQPWPYAGPIAVRENGDLHVVDCWAYLGSVASLEDAAPLLAKGQQRFDRDTYLILRKWLDRHRGTVIAL